MAAVNAPRTETQYEKNQRFNALVSWLHSFRYRNIVEVFDRLSTADNAGPVRVVEIGCAHAKLFSTLNDKFDIDYTGIELKEDRVDAACERYRGRTNFRIIHDEIGNRLEVIKQGDVVVALETLEHIPEHSVVRIVERIAKAKPRLFICSVPVEVGPVVWVKNVGSFIMGYMRHQEYTWRETFWAGLGKLDKLPPHWRNHKGFDWRWLAQTIRHNLRIVEIRKFPFGILPACLNTSVFFVSEPRDGGAIRKRRGG